MGGNISFFPFRAAPSSVAAIRRTVQLRLQRGISDGWWFSMWILSYLISFHVYGICFIYSLFGTYLSFHLFPFRLVFSIHSVVRWMRRQGETAQECVPALQSSKGERSNIQGGASAATPPQRMEHSSRAAIRKEGLPFSAEAGLLPDFTQDNASFPILPHGRWPFSKKAASFNLNYS